MGSDVWPGTGSSSNTVTAAILARAQALCGATLNVLSGAEFDGTGGYVQTLAGSGTAGLSNTDKAGVVKVQSGTTGNSTAAVTLGGQATFATVIDNQKTSKWYAYWRVRMATTVDAASQLDCQLFGGANSRISVGQAGGTSTTNWRIAISDGAGTNIATQTVAMALDTNWHDVEVWNDGTNITIAIDGAQQYQTAITALASGQALGQRLFAGNGASAVNRELDADRMYAVVASS